MPRLKPPSPTFVELPECWLDEKLYPSHARNWDDTLFRERILSHLLQGTPKDVLDLGAGAGYVPQMNFKGIARRICDVDPDPRVVDNPYLDEGRVGIGESIPYGDGEFDLVFADNVLEHLPNPEKVFAEVFRVLRRGGILWPQCVSTHYLANIPKDVRRLAEKTGFDVGAIELIEGRPEYTLLGDPSKAKNKLDWLPKVTFGELVSEEFKSAERHELVKNRGLAVTMIMSNVPRTERPS